jgi:NAD+ diphosphatase
MTYSFIATVNQPEDDIAPAYWFFIQGFRLLVHSDEHDVHIPLTNNPDSIVASIARRQYLGYLETPSGPLNCYSAEIPEDWDPPEGMAFLSLRRLFGKLDDGMVALAGRAVQIVEWDRTHQFCGRCGIPVHYVQSERAKECPQCGLTNYPRLAPAIIVSIERWTAKGTEILLAHNHRAPKGFYSVLAGFVEPGETLEECVIREVREEVGIDITNIRYFGSQPWPFPNSLMIAFTAEYKNGEIEVEEAEIGDAAWYSASSLPHIPPRISIARQLIDTFVEKNSKHS